MSARALAGDLAQLEDLVRNLEGKSGTPNALMREHLEAARFYLLGAMPREYSLTLKLVEDLVPDIEDQNLQTLVAGFLSSRQSRIA